MSYNSFFSWKQIPHVFPEKKKKNSGLLKPAWRLDDGRCEVYFTTVAVVCTFSVFQPGCSAMLEFLFFFVLRFFVLFFFGVFLFFIFLKLLLLIFGLFGVCFLFRLFFDCFWVLKKNKNTVLRHRIGVLLFEVFF